MSGMHVEPQPGKLKVITGTDPAAGTQIIETVPAGTRWRLLNMHCRLVTDATVGNRFPSLTIEDENGGIVFVVTGPAQAASTTRSYHCAPLGYALTAASANHPMPVPIGLLLGPGYELTFGAAGLEAGDDYDAPVLLVEEYPAE